MEDAKHKRKIETVEQLFGYFLYSGDDFEDWLCARKWRNCWHFENYE